jgi:hypothetical protein
MIHALLLQNIIKNTLRIIVHDSERLGEYAKLLQNPNLGNFHPTSQDLSWADDTAETATSPGFSASVYIAPALSEFNQDLGASPR